jgi:hypothetical protein
MPIDRLRDEEIGVRAFQCVVDRLRQRGRTVDAALFESAFDLLGQDQRASSVVHSHIFRFGINGIKAGMHGILSPFAAGDNRLELFESGVATNVLDLIAPIFARHDNDFADRSRLIECADCVSDHRFACCDGKEFIESHSVAATTRDDDGA